MVDLTKYKSLLDEEIKVVCTDGQVIAGEWIDWASALDNEPDPEAITIKKRDGSLVMIFVPEIKDIQKA